MAFESLPLPAEYELPSRAWDRFSPDETGTKHADSLPEHFLARYVVWLCKFRWFVVSLLLAFGLASFHPEVLLRIGLQPYRVWPLAASAILALANLCFLAHGRLSATARAASGARANLWAQITLDLLVLTVVVHYMGSLETYVAFSYLFHIVLACIFFSRLRSLGVMALAFFLYGACIILEQTGAIPSAGIYLNGALRAQMDKIPAVTFISVAWVIYIWTAVWYLASHISAIVRERDSELAETNCRLVEAQEEKTRHMLRTTHELKAPVASIQANVQLLQKGYCGVLPSEAHEILARVGTRCRRLAHEIQQMLQLASLRQASEGRLRRAQLDLGEILRWCTGQLLALAEQKEVAIRENIQPAFALAVEDHMKMLFSNILSNAVSYSRPGGVVRVACSPGPGGNPVITIADDGIGISSSKLPHIFDEYYRTDEAAQHNKESTGLGLAIVQHIARTHFINVRVKSQPGKGTQFTLGFPCVEESRHETMGRKEVIDGLPVDN